MKKITLKMKKITPFIYNLYRVLQKFARILQNSMWVLSISDMGSVNF